MKIINLDHNLEIFNSKDSGVIFKTYENNVVSLDDKTGETYFMLESVILIIERNKYFCEKVTIDFMGPEKEIFLIEVTNLDLLKNKEEYQLKNKEIKELSKKIHKTINQLYKDYKSIEKIWDVHIMIKKFLIAREMLNV